MIYKGDGILKPISTSLDFFICLAKAYNVAARRFNGRLGTLHGLSFGDFLILLHLSRARGKLRRVDLADRLGLTASAVARSLNLLERIDLVARERGTRDARVGYATLTKAGQRLLEESLKTAEVICKGTIPSTRASQLDTLFNLLTDLGGG